MSKFTIEIDETTGYYDVTFDNLSIGSVKQALIWVIAERIIEKKLETQE